MPLYTSVPALDLEQGIVVGRVPRQREGRVAGLGERFDVVMLSRVFDRYGWQVRGAYGLEAGRWRVRESSCAFFKRAIRAATAA